MIGLVGAGLVGAHAVDALIQRGQAQLLVHDVNVAASNRLVSKRSSARNRVTAVQVNDLFSANVVVLACPPPHAKAARRFLESGVGVVSCSDDVDDTLAMLELDAMARAAGRTLVVGATMSPGLSGLLVRAISLGFDDVDEAHVAIHGTAGPACAQQHHRALGGQAIGWHDGDWLRRPAGSGRELCWFPDPVGPRDCYRAELTDPLVIQRALPELTRVTVRMSATRRDRLTARLPMLTPPHAEGGVGALRIEVRGWRNAGRHVEVVGIADRVGHVAGLVAAATARRLIAGDFSAGVRVLGDAGSPNADLLNDLVVDGLHLHEFVGSAQD